MQIETSGILINMKPFSERDAVAHIFTCDNGVLVGMLRGAMVAKKNKPLVGQYGIVSWNARLDSQLGVFHFESEKNLSAPLMLNADFLKIMNAAFSLIYSLLPEREAYEHLYKKIYLAGVAGASAAGVSAPLAGVAASFDDAGACDAPKPGNVFEPTGACWVAAFSITEPD